MLQTTKKYKCDRCGHVTEQKTNHFGPTWSAGRCNTCPKCPPWAKYSEFGSRTTWTCMDAQPDSTKGECMECGAPSVDEVCNACKRCPNNMRL